MRSFICLLVSVSFFYSCQKEIAIPDTEAEMIFGEWEWYRSVNSGWATESTPVSEGYNRELIIERTGKYTSYINGEIDQTKKFSLVMDPERTWPTPYFLEFNDNISLMVYKLSADTLAFCPYKCNDCNIVYYKRKKID